MSEERTIGELEQDPREKRIIDIRSRDSFDRGTYPGAENIPIEGFDPAQIAAESRVPIYLVCQKGVQSQDLADELEALGCEAYSVTGGYMDYLRQKLRAMAADSALAEERRRMAEQSILKKFRRQFWSPFTRALREYRLIEDGDRIAVCISGGKDSMLMAKLFQELLRHGKQNFEAVFLVMDPGYNELNYRTVTENAKLLGVPIQTFHTEIFDIVAVRGGSPCYLCARMRRGYLYSKARELGCNKIALGHHYDDVIETIFMGMLYGGQVQTMMPKLHSTNFAGMELIRPLYLVREADIIRWRDYNNLHFIQCACRLTESCASCGGTGQGSKRSEVKALIRQIAARDPQIEQNIFRSVENVNLNTVIAYKKDSVKHHFLDTYDRQKSVESED